MLIEKYKVEIKLTPAVEARRLLKLVGLLYSPRFREDLLLILMLFSNLHTLLQVWNIN